ncbi:MAG: LPXTG cell wall anchor domain-containing protein [Candidatus Omnitrophica bacterium]|nr:LPXTG cell wall anchor domain-containing protein [Candidatus Omnitrophota bacterium]
MALCNRQQATGNKQQAAAFLLVACLLSLVASAAALADTGEPRISASLDRTEITIGDRIKLSLEVDVPGSSRVETPDLQGKLGGLELKAIEKKEPNIFAITLTGYSVGKYIIPPVSITVHLPDGSVSSLSTLQLFVEIKSILKEGETMQDIRDIKGVLRLAGFWVSPSVLVGLLLLLSLIAWFFLRKKKKFLPMEASPPRPPHLLALQELDRIDGSGLSKTNVKEYYFLISNVLRHYLEGRFSYRAPEQTTEEFLEATSEDSVLNESQKKLLKHFLEQCDLVKFANWTPPPVEVLRLSRTAREFIYETK